MIIANVNGLEIAYERRGQGPPLLLLHGYPLDHSIWHEVAGLLGSSFDVVLPDLRGFGQSSAPEHEYGMADMAADLAGLLDHLGMERAALAGHSMGGYVALAFARAYPARISGLGLVSSQAVADTPEGRERRYDTARRVAEQGVGLVAESMPDKLSPDPRVQSLCADLIRQQRPAGIIGALKAMAGREDSSPNLPSLSIAVSVLHGDADALIPIERAREVRAAIPHARLTLFPQGGHMLMLESPQATADALKLLA
jgi:pimeloyl-ACP methyl ester carboxylesterase